MKTYGQFCAVARGLDVVGDRWTLLIVRDLLDGPRRYGALRAGLPGIATNLLGDRLKALVDAGVVHHDDGRYALTDWGEGLRDVVHAVGRWAMPLMVRPPEGDAFRTSWLRRLVAINLDHVDPRRPDAVVALRCDGDDEVVTLVVRDGLVSLGGDEVPDVTVGGPPHGVGALVCGFIGVADAQARGVAVAGDASLLPAAPQA